MAAGSLRRRLEQIPISNDYGLERLHVSFHAQPVPLIQLTDTNKIINSSTATFMTRSLKKTTSPELQISPEQASEQQSSWQASARRAAKWLTPIVDFQEGRPTRNWLHGTNEPPPLNARNNFNATRPLNNSSKIGQKNISFFYFFLSFFSLSLSLSLPLAPWQIAVGGGEGRRGGEGVKFLTDGKICIDNRGAPFPPPVKSARRWLNANDGWVGERETNPVTITHHRCNLFFTTPKECLNYSIDKAAGPFSAWRRGRKSKGSRKKVSPRATTIEIGHGPRTNFLLPFIFPVTVLAY